MSNAYHRSGKHGWLMFLAGFAMSLFVGWVVFPQALYSSKSQPFAFSHAVHGEDGPAGLSCEECHSFREDGSFSGVPTLAGCLDCHSDMQGTSPEEDAFHDAAVRMKAAGGEAQWFVEAKQPPCVYFSHAAHVYSAELACEECHRDVEKETSLPAGRQDRISGYSKFVAENMTMNDCADCHTRSGADNACFVCHK